MTDSHPQDAPFAICLGELVIDFISLEPGRALWEVARFERHVGGSPANVAAGLHHHGVPVRLWSKVGRDALGRFALSAIRAQGLSTEGIAVDPRHPTKLALIGGEAGGGRRIEIVGRDSADGHLALEEVDDAAFRTCRLFHFGGTALLGSTTAETTRRLLPRARTASCLVSFDPNIRLSPGSDGLRARLREALGSVDLLKGSAAGWQNLWGDLTPEAMIAGGVSLVVLTEGARGATLLTPRHRVRVPAASAQAIDPTGAGDAFGAALLARAYHLPPSRSPADLSEAELQAWGRFASRWAARIVRHRGALTGYGKRKA